MRLAAAGAAGLLLAACSSPLPLEPTAHYPPVSEARPTAPSPRPVRTVSADACGAAPLQSLVGRPRTEIPVPLDPGRQRVACTTCPVSDDQRPERLNFLFDAQTGLIRQIRCG